jgi:hypothetical protein
MVYAIFIALGLLAGLARAAHDAASFTPGCLARFGQFWDNRTSWLNKYKNRDATAGPAFLGATTWLVAFTDGWHLSNLAAWAAADAAALWAAWGSPKWWWAVGYVLARRVVFEPVYSRLRKSA